VFLENQDFPQTALLSPANNFLHGPELSALRQRYLLSSVLSKPTANSPIWRPLLYLQVDKLGTKPSDLPSRDYRRTALGFYR
jgi:hypothetical protein